MRFSMMSFLKALWGAVSGTVICAYMYVVIIILIKLAASSRHSSVSWYAEYKAMCDMTGIQIRRWSKNIVVESRAVGFFGQDLLSVFFGPILSLLQANHGCRSIISTQSHTFRCGRIVYSQAGIKALEKWNLQDRDTFGRFWFMFACPSQTKVLPIVCMLNILREC